jgi:small subunit ribosomal protein S6
LATHVYEGMFILDSNRYGRNPESVVNQIPKMIEQAGGELLVSRLWEERRLAYPIEGHRKGTYWLTYFRVDGKEVAGLERKCRLSESILRVLFLKVDPRIVDALIAHAQSGSPTAEGSGGDGEGQRTTVSSRAAHSAGDDSDNDLEGSGDDDEEEKD